MERSLAKGEKEIMSVDLALDWLINNIWFILPPLLVGYLAYLYLKKKREQPRQYIDFEKLHKSKRISHEEFNAVKGWHLYRGDVWLGKILTYREEHQPNGKKGYERISILTLQPNFVQLGRLKIPKVWRKEVWHINTSLLTQAQQPGHNPGFRDMLVPSPNLKLPFYVGVFKRNQINYVLTPNTEPVIQNLQKYEQITLEEMKVDIFAKNMMALTPIRQDYAHEERIKRIEAQLERERRGAEIAWRAEK